MGGPCGKSTGQPGGSSTNYRDNGGSPNARNDPNNNPIPPIDQPDIAPEATNLTVHGRANINAGVLNVTANNGFQPSRDPGLLSLGDAISRMASAHEEIAQLKQTVTQKDERIKELTDQNTQLITDKTKLEQENEKLKRILADPKAEIESLEGDIEIFKQWTKKLDC